MRLLLVLVLIVVGALAGGGAGYALRPSGPPPMPVPEEEAAPDGTYAFVEFGSQFVVPLTEDGEITGLVALSLSVETEATQAQTVMDREPRLRDAFLRVLFDHANAGGFDGAFTDGQRMRDLRTRLDMAASEELGSAARGVLITNLARQDM
ncbi:flagellar basal body-associated FliL family protein [Pontivivens ytuae]|uniref:Flagellar protein FliL n=1 Tax=Pontivivens ytuae TaxID=2789856 RepID=A0A7S9QC73_9RHOB|nr:flagellar basal body-associated FliL family protein [Pontivivens ytuae]QPH53092.1 flagellar basal body-associated FliL family protein [Pontivivens ytuae]